MELFSVAWSYGTQGKILIPNNNVFLPTLVGSSPYTINVIANVCGDGKRTGSEIWDDNNSSSGDGWNATWTIETGWTWSGGTASTRDTWTEIWGDGKRFNLLSTYWDDANIVGGDGWSSTWSVENGYTWSGGTSTASDVWSETWGDAKRFNIIATYWDDGNTSNGDGCSSNWSIETGWICSGGTLTSPDSWSEIWGDGKRFNLIATYWDDGNTSNGDGCSSNWSIETGWICSGGTLTSPDSWSEIWGDGKRFNLIATYWDDGNTSNGDGCSSNWSAETGFTWSGGSSTSSDVWSDTCGDGKHYSSLATFWDDGNTIRGDGWNSSWSIETGWTCSGGSSTSKDNWNEIWGDGKRFNSLSTFWDDGNSINGDGCSSTWSIETGYTWTGGTSTTSDVWNDICGDGKSYSSLVTFCDDGNTTGGDGCSSTWSIETGWNCSGGTTSTKDTCNKICGDGKRFNSLSTYWDDGNTSNSDGWNSSWQVEAGWNWSGGSSTTKDTWTEIWGDSKRFNTISTYWDDGNISSSDGCSATWQVETGWTWSGGTTSSKDIWTEIWGDAKRFNSLSTYWGDGNTSNSDGWNSSWLIETGWNWFGGSSTSKDTWTEIWGDGIRFNILTTYCDDANTLNGDGCNSSWNVESGWKWTGGSITLSDSWYDIWGDGKNVTPLSSNWDDGNLLNNDGWSSNCKVEVGWNCSGGSNTLKDIWKEIWGKKFKYKT